MCKNLINRLWCGKHLFFISFCWCFFTGCASNNAQNGWPLDLMQKFNPNIYYIMHVDGKEYVIKQDVFNVKKCEFTWYDANSKSAMVSPQKLQIKIKRNRCILLYKGGKKVVKKADYNLEDLTWRGTCEWKGKTVSFDFVEYHTADYATFSHRYQKKIFNYKVEKNISYGHASGYWTSNISAKNNYADVLATGISKSLKKRDLNLTMDLYIPQNDDLKARPLLMFIHGGAFYMGDKSDNPIVLWCKHFASLGYVVASINYRMGFQPTKRAIERCGYGAVQDAHAAMRYLLENKNVYHINPDYLFVAGSSAGGITALNLAFMRNQNRPESTQKGLLSEDMGNIESSGNNSKQSFTIRAIGNMWGAVNDVQMLKNSRAAIVSFHGNADKIVPYDYDTPMAFLKSDVNELFFDKMYGSAAIHRQAKKLKYREKLYTFDNAGHAPHVDENNQPNDKFWFIQDKMTQFFYEEFVPASMKLADMGNHYFGLLGAPEIDQLYWKIEGGFILGEKSDQVRVIWRQDAPTHRLSVSGKLKNGAAVEDTYSPDGPK